MYVVIGATGHTGTVVAKHLLSAGKRVRAISRHADRLQSLASDGAEPFVADVTNSDALTKAFTGAEGVYAMIPPDMASPDFGGYQKRVTEAIASALEKTGVKHAVTLSSVGADKQDKTGPVVGLHNMEQRLNRIAGLNVLHLRAGDFMENMLAQVGTIQAIGKTAGPERPDLKLPWIATRDIGAAAAAALLNLNLKNHQTRELLGQRDLDMTEATAIIGKAINKPDLQYVQLPDVQLRPILLQLGMSASLADSILEMSAALNSGHMRALEKRSPQNTTPTSFETFVASVFLPAYQAKSRAA